MAAAQRMDAEEAANNHDRVRVLLTSAVAPLLPAALLALRLRQTRLPRPPWRARNHPPSRRRLLAHMGCVLMPTTRATGRSRGESQQRPCRGPHRTAVAGTVLSSCDPRKHACAAAARMQRRGCRQQVETARTRCMIKAPLRFRLLQPPLMALSGLAMAAALHPQAAAAAAALPISC